MKYLLTVLLLVTFNINHLQACINFFSVDSSGRTHFLEHRFFSSIQFNHGHIKSKLLQMEQDFAKGHYNYRHISDYGAYLLMSGRFKEGLQIFRALAAKHDSLYIIKANLAVAYELNGQIDSALLWERAAIAQNPNAHDGSEWIHLKILEARKGLQQDPAWLEKNNVTAFVDSVKANHTFTEHEGQKNCCRFKHFIDQLSERLPFTYAPDPVMGKLMFEVGDAYMFTSAYRAYYCYALAKVFYPALQASATTKMQSIIAKYPAARGKVRTEMDREMQAPDAAEANRFITDIIQRPQLKEIKLRTWPIEELLEKI